MKKSGPSIRILKENSMTARAKKKVYRVCFDFRSADLAIDFWEDFVEALAPDSNEFRHCELVHKDHLHDQDSKVHSFLVRRREGSLGTGSKHTKIPKLVSVKNPGGS